MFWRNVPPDRYRLLATDLIGGVDSRALPYKDGEIDCVVFDPPYMHSPGGTAHRGHKPFERYYRNNGTGNRTGAKYHEAVLELYVRCRDEGCSNRQRFTHVEIMQAYEDMGFVAEDLFVLVRRNRPGASRVVKQVHARKNHSYFLVFWKPGEVGGLWTPPE